MSDTESTCRSNPCFSCLSCLTAILLHGDITDLMGWGLGIWKCKSGMSELWPAEVEMFRWQAILAVVVHELSEGSKLATLDLVRL